MACYLKTTCKLVAIIVIFGSTLPAYADSNQDDFNGLFYYFSKEQQRARDEGIVLERTKGRTKGSSSTLSLFGKGADSLPDNFSRNNFSGRDFTKEEPIGILNFRIKF